MDPAGGWNGFSFFQENPGNQQWGISFPWSVNAYLVAGFKMFLVFYPKNWEGWNHQQENYVKCQQEKLSGTLGKEWFLFCWSA